MTTLAAGSSVTITLDGDDVLTTDGNATFQITPTTGGKGEGYLTGRQTLGPYRQYVTIVLTAINPVTYSQASDVGAAEVARYAKDASGNITGLASGDGEFSFPYALLQTAVPICLPPGNGSTVGLKFTNTSGAFSLTTTTFTSTYSTGIWLYMPVGAFDGTIPAVAGFYWALMSSASVGQLYNVPYQSAVPTVTEADYCATTLNRWLTQVTATVTFVQASLAAGALGANGTLTYRHVWSCFNSAGAKTLGLLLDSGVTITSISPTTNGGYNGFTSIANRGVSNKQVAPGQGSGGQGINTMTGNAPIYSVDTTVAISPGATGQLAVNTDYLILESLAIQVLPL